MSHYEVLGVDRDADPATLHRAYLEQARRHHPDLNGTDSEQMLRINEAWAVLGDPLRRDRYDETLRLADRRVRVTRLDASGFTPIDDEDDDDSWRYEDDVGDPRTAPKRVVVLAPLVTVALSIAAAVVWVVTAHEVALGLTVVFGALSVVGFLVAPLVAMAKASRYERHD